MLDATIQVVLDEQPPVFSAALGWLEPSLADQCRRRGIKVMAMISTVEDARAAAAGGADVIVAQGGEAGGHRSIVLVFADKKRHGEDKHGHRKRAYERSYHNALVCRQHEPYQEDDQAELDRLGPERS